MGKSIPYAGHSRNNILTGTGVVKKRHLNFEVMTTGIGWWNIVEIKRK